MSSWVTFNHVFSPLIEDLRLEFRSSSLFDGSSRTSKAERVCRLEKWTCSFYPMSHNAKSIYFKNGMEKRISLSISVLLVFMELCNLKISGVRPFCKLIPEMVYQNFFCHLSFHTKTYFCYILATLFAQVSNDNIKWTWSVLPFNPWIFLKSRSFSGRKSHGSW